jgi:hypothetical protein
VKTKPDRGSQDRKDVGGRKPRSAWPLDVMVSTASMVVEQKLATQRVAAELHIPYTTVSDWVKGAYTLDYVFKHCECKSDAYE